MHKAGIACAIALLASCEKPARHQLDLDLIRVTGDAKLRTDQVGDAGYNEVATFVLVDAQNTGTEGAYVTLAGELTDGSEPVSEFKAQSLWIPPGETRTFAMVDRERKPRPTAKSARIKVRSATIPEHAPPASVDHIREIEDDGKLVVQGTVHNTAPRPGNLVVIASFHGPDGNPMTRPFTILRVEAATDQPVQFVSPPGAKHGTIFIGEMSY